MNEPVAYINVEQRKLEWATPTRWETPTVAVMDKIPLYTAPPQREYEKENDAVHALTEEDGLIVHDDVPHPIDMTFDEEENPQ